MKNAALLALALSLAFSAKAAPPSNDSFASRVDLGSPTTFSVSSDNIEASLEASEPDFGGIVGNSVWYQWTAPSTGWVSLTTAVSSLDSVIGVFTGTSVNTLVQIGFNDEDNDAVELGTDHFSRLNFRAVAGTVYKISVGGWTDGSFTDQGSFTLSLAPITPAFNVSALSLTPDPVTITNASAAMTLNVTAGTTQPGPVSFKVTMHPANDPTRPFELLFTDAQRTSGNAVNGIYQLAFTLPRYLPAGNWLANVIATDGLRDTQWSFGADNLQDDFVFPTAADPVLSVINTGIVDSAPPVLTSLSATPATINAGTVAQSGRVITFTLHITDNLSGYNACVITLVGPNEEAVVATALTLTSGTALDGDYTVNAIVPYALEAGSYAIRIRLTDASLFSATYSSESGADLLLPSGSPAQITITGTAGYPAWTKTQVFSGGQFAPLLDADHDGIPNLAEYAFNLQPSTSDNAPVAANIGTSGMPNITLVAGKLRIEFIRRKASTNSGLTYLPQFSDTLLETGTGAWTNATGTPTVTSIDDTWERVIITDTVTGSSQRFARVKLNYTQP